VSTEAAMKYFVLGALASGFLLYGLSMMYGATGTLEIPRGLRRHRHGQHQQGGAGFRRRVRRRRPGLQARRRALPHVGARRLPGRADGGHAADRRRPKLAAFAITIRLLVEGHARAGHRLAADVHRAGGGSLVVGNLAAIAQTNLKRMLAYSTIAQMGFVLLGLSAGVVSGNTCRPAMPTARPCSTWSATCSPRWAPSA
jgi:NADH-quinone oxidoreductase subunit N